jgi:peptidyl-prolyl cis-trans isomerase SurA
MLKTMSGTFGLFAALLMMAVATTPAPAQTMFRPVAVVNDSAITGYDLAQRAQIMVALGFPSASPDALRRAALDRLIEDRLKMQEGVRAGMTATPELIQAGIEKFAKNSNLSADEFRVVLSAKGVSEQSLNDLISSEVVWRQLVRGRALRRVEPGEAEIDAEIELLLQRAGVSYRIAEIGLPINDAGRSAAETQALADRISASLNAGGDFSAAVKTYSRAPSAPRGGEVGWVAGAQLPPEVSAALAALTPGEVTSPMPVSGGLSIIKLLERRTDAGAAADTGNPELRERVRRGLVNRRMNRFAEGLLQELRRDALIELR